MADKDVAYSATVADAAAPPGATTIPDARGTSSQLGLSARSTVLPRLVRSGDDVARGPGGQRFVPVRLLGTGGLGEVTLVHDNDIDRPVALKRLRAGAVSDELVYRFAEEIRTVGRLEHPNIAPVHDVGIDDTGQHYFVMRYIEGETLEHVITRLAQGDAAYHARFTFEHRVHVFFGILNAIGYAHAQNIIHRDIKPSNIMVGPYGEVVVMDWGIAKKRGAAEARGDDDAAPDEIYRTRDGSLVGTPAYMSPEQAQGANDRIDERSDIYSLTAVLYELLTLQHYLPGRATVPALLAAIADDPHVFASSVASAHQPPVPAELAWFVETGLEKDPSKRFQSVAAMTERLEHVMAGEFAVQCPVTLIKSVGNGGLRLVDRYPWVMLVGTVVVVAVFVAGIVSLLARL